MDASLIAIGRRADTKTLSLSQVTTEPIMRLTSQRYSEAEGDQTERLASPATRRRSTSGGDEAAAIEVQRVKFEV